MGKDGNFRPPESRDRQDAVRPGGRFCAVKGALRVREEVGGDIGIGVPVQEERESGQESGA